MSTASAEINGASFRDPDAFVFSSDGQIYRQINRSYADDFALLSTSGLYAKLTELKLLVAHEESAVSPITTDGVKVIKPQQIPFISYPYEWSFEQLRSAALLTLEIEEQALLHDMTTKDATAFNVQFIGSRPIFIDSASFIHFDASRPWHGYKQFCEHFLAPLILASSTDDRAARLGMPLLNGMPVDLASKLLPPSSWFDPGCLMHIHFHAKLLSKSYEQKTAPGKFSFDKHSQLAILDNLRGMIKKLRRPRTHSMWLDYYATSNYTEESSSHKAATIGRLLNDIHPSVVWDLGANTGKYSEIAEAAGAYVIAFEQDATCVDEMFKRWTSTQNTHCLPLVMDLTNPTPALGWQNCERMSLLQRGPADCVITLALLHHLILRAEVTMAKLAEFFCRLTPRLFIEFVPMDDPQSKRLLEGQRLSHHSYTEDDFRAAFTRLFRIVERIPVTGTERAIYHLSSR